MSEAIVITPVALRSPESEVALCLKDRGYEVRIHDSHLPPTPAEQLELLAGASGVILGPESLDRAVLEQLPQLKVISRYGVGYDNIDLRAATDLGIVATYVPDAMVDAVADLTMALLLAAARKLTHFDRELKAGEWRRTPAADVTGATLGLVGTGRIGLAVARRSKAFGMRLLGCDPYPNERFTREVDGEYLGLRDLLSQSDYISLHLPGGAETRHLCDRTTLSLLQPHAYVINCARGSLVDDEAMIQALEEGKLAGYATDVFSTEPPSPGSAAERLMKMPQVTATPHVASFTPRTVLKMGEAARNNLLAALNGDRPEFVCNPEVYDGNPRVLAPESR